MSDPGLDWLGWVVVIWSVIWSLVGFVSLHQSHKRQQAARRRDALNRERAIERGANRW